MWAAIAGIVGNALITKGTEQLIGGKGEAGSKAFEDMVTGDKRDYYTRMAKNVRSETAGQMYGGGDSGKTDMRQTLNSIYARAYNEAPNMAQSIIRQAMAENQNKSVIKQIKHDFNFHEASEGKRLS